MCAPPKSKLSHFQRWGHCPLCPCSPRKLPCLDLSAGHMQAQLCCCTCLFSHAQTFNREMIGTTHGLVDTLAKGKAGPEVGAAIRGHPPLSQLWGSFWTLLSLPPAPHPPPRFSPRPESLFQGRTWAGPMPEAPSLWLFSRYRAPIRHPTWVLGFIE